VTSDELLARVVAADVIYGEPELDFWKRHARARAIRITGQRRILTHYVHCLDAAYAVVRRHREIQGLPAELDDARDEVMDMLQEMEEEMTT
jgi:3-hydroxy-3-methylglutaryl CoA synthase